VTSLLIRENLHCPTLHPKPLPTTTTMAVVAVSTDCGFQELQRALARASA
jgi:hypothetical protein